MTLVYCLTAYGMRRHIQQPDDKTHTLCGLMVGVPDMNGWFESMPVCQRCVRRAS